MKRMRYQQQQMMLGKSHYPSFTAFWFLPLQNVAELKSAMCKVLSLDKDAMRVCYSHLDDHYPLRASDELQSLDLGLDHLFVIEVLLEKITAIVPFRSCASSASSRNLTKVVAGTATGVLLKRFPFSIFFSNLSGRQRTCPGRNDRLRQAAEWRTVCRARRVAVDEAASTDGRHSRNVFFDR